MLDINFTDTAKKSIILTVFSLFLLSCIFLLMIGSTFHTAAPPKTYLGADNSAETVSERISFLRELGYNVIPTDEEEESIRIPMEFGDVYTSYNELQKESGTDLRNYRGCECTRFTYTLQTENGEKRINLIVYRGRVIGGDISTAALNGEMTALSANGT